MQTIPHFVIRCALLTFVLATALPAPADTVRVDGNPHTTLADALSALNLNDGQADVIEIHLDRIDEPAVLGLRPADDLSILGDTDGNGTPVRIVAPGGDNFLTFNGYSNSKIFLKDLVIVPAFGKTGHNAAIRLECGNDVHANSLELENVTITASIDTDNAPADEDRPYNEADTHFVYGFYNGTQREATADNAIAIRNSRLLHAERSNIRLSTHYAVAVHIKDSLCNRSLGNGLQLEQIGLLDITLTRSQASHNGVAGIYYRGGLAPCTLTLAEGTQLNHNGRWGLYSHGDKGALRKIVVRGTHENPVQTSHNALSGLQFSQFDEGAQPRLGPAEYWVSIGNRNHWYFDARVPTAPAQLGPFRHLLFAQGERDAIVWRISNVSASFQSSTFANNPAYHNYARWGGKNLGAPNQFEFVDCLFSGGENRAAFYDVDNGDSVLLRNCGLVTEGPVGMQWSPPWKTDAGGKIEVGNPVYADPAYVSQQVDPLAPDAFTVDSPAYVGKASDGGDLSGYGEYRGSGDVSASVPAPPPVITDDLSAEYAYRHKQQREEPDYRAHLLASLPEPLPFEFEEGREYRAELARAAALHCYLAEYSGRGEYAQRAVEMLDGLLRGWSRHDDFFSLMPAMLAFRKLDDAGLIDSETRAAMREIVASKYHPWQRGNHNQTACRVAGVALALQQFPDIEDYDERMAYIEAGWNDWYSVKDTVENAPNYNRIFWQHYFVVADSQGWTEQLKDPDVHATLLRFRDQITPAGVIPGYGDSDPFYHEEMWCSVFEYAAALYQDPTLRWAAWQMLPFPQPDPAAILENAKRGNYRPASYLFSYCLADQWKNPEIRPRKPDIGAQLLTRRTPDSDAAFNKIILAPGRAPGMPYAMLEIFAKQGGHSHPESAALQYYEVDGRPMLHGVGYNNRYPNHGNIVHLAPGNEPWPHKAEPFTTGEWHHEKYNLKDFWPRDKMPEPGIHPHALEAEKEPGPETPDLDKRHFDNLIFRVENSGRAARDDVPLIHLWVDNLKLTGPAGEKMLDDFEGDVAERWRHGYGVEPSDDARQGSQSMRANCQGGVNFITREFDLTWDYSDYQYLKFDWKLSANPNGWTRPFLLRLSDRGRDYTWYVNVMPLKPRVEDASVDQRDGDSYGEITHSEYFTADTRTRRQVVLTREGVLLVRDTVQPGPEADGFQGGPLYHLWNYPSAHGDNWLSAPGFSEYAAQDRNILVQHAPAPGREYGFQFADLWGIYDPHTAYARQEFEAGKTYHFTTAILVHEPDQDAGKIVEKTNFKTDASGSQLRLELPDGQPLSIRIAEDGNWKVER